MFGDIESFSPNSTQFPRYREMADVPLEIMKRSTVGQKEAEERSAVKEKNREGEGAMERGNRK